MDDVILSLTRLIADDADRAYVANTARIPPSGTLVTMYLQPASAAKPK